MERKTNISNFKKKQTEEEMRLAREWKIKNKEQHLARDAPRERAEFERVLKLQLTQPEKERQQQLQQISKRQQFDDDLRQQIVKHEKQKVQQRAEFFDERVQLDEQARLRRIPIEQIKTQKLNELREQFFSKKLETNFFSLVELVYQKNTGTI
jgi:hypothetical protein